MWLGIVGGTVGIACGEIPTLQPAGFGRVYAAYGGFFIVLSLLWGGVFEGNAPDRYLIGGLICVAGALIIMYAPRTH